ncbi:hypothetical protein MTR67_007502 [Solanum verrucosum]|uniref:C3H1-type domain-containing protein n=1 Tax=Solanum verrucosum TaxID=315347 RepID=A0AAF0Q0C8_SOLVR|nr:hypothetical protein MTR67_007502 [Solanum verrucosum]
MDEGEGGLNFDFEGGLDTGPTHPTASVPVIQSFDHTAAAAPSANINPPTVSAAVGGQSDVGFVGNRRSFRQTVCRHWLRSLCMKGDACGFLHQYDKSRMPICRFFRLYGECREQDCVYKHTIEDIKECNIKYILDLLANTGKLAAKPCNTPMVPNVHLMKDDGDPFDDLERYRRLVGKLNYLTVTRLDIAFAVSVVRAPGLGILYNNHGHTRVECFVDADWAGSKIDRRSTTGYCVFVGGNLVSWRSKKQGVVSRSSAESEYRAMSQSTCEIMCIHYLLTEIGLKHHTPAKLWCDNQAALHIASNPVYHERTKHIEVDCHFIREKIQENLISTGYMKTREKLVDLLTKALNGTRVDYLCNKLGMINIYAPA